MSQPSFFLLLSVIISTGLMASCGKKADLYLPEDQLIQEQTNNQLQSQSQSDPQPESQSQLQ